VGLSLFSPAKVNLFLRVLGRRADGYHNLASLFQAVDLGDHLTFSLFPKDHLTCTDPTIPLDNSNLILKAANLFRQKTGLSFGLAAHLEKKIPMEAGLGGGSSNAATTLWALNELTDHPASEDELRTWAAELGADVAFFFSSGTAFCTGYGQHVRSLAPLSQTEPLYLVKPPEGLSTEHIFRLLDFATCSSEDPEALLQNFLQGKPQYLNDLEEPALRALPSLKSLKQKLLKDGFHTVAMTGSGTGFLCVGDGTGDHQPLHYLSRREGDWYYEIVS